MKKPITAVIDTSVVVSALMSKTGASAAILDSFIERKPFIWVMSPGLYDEYLRKAASKMLELQKRETSRGGDAATMAGRVEDVLHYIAKESAWLDVGHVMKGVTKDPGDDAFATLAIEAGVNYLLGVMAAAIAASKSSAHA